MDRRADVAVAATFLAFGVWLFWAAGQIPRGSVPDPIGSGGLARALALIIVGFSAWVVVRRVVRWRREERLVHAEGSTDQPGVPASSARGFTVLGLVLAYVLAIPVLGYLPTTPVFLLGVLWVMKVRSARRLVLVPVVYTVVTYALFVGLFGVLLPLGVLERWDRYLWFHF